jgi:hypothetical protein
MRARRPAAGCEPFLETVGQQRGRWFGEHWRKAGRHRENVWCPPGFVEGGLAQWSRELPPRPACGERPDRIDRCDPGEGAIRVFLSFQICGGSPSPYPLPAKGGEREEAAYAGREAAHSVTGLSEISQSLPLKIEM